MTPEDTAACFVRCLIDSEFEQAWEMLHPDMQADYTPDDLAAIWNRDVPCNGEQFQHAPQLEAEGDSIRFRIEVQSGGERADVQITIDTDSRSVTDLNVAA